MDSLYLKTCTPYERRLLLNKLSDLTEEEQKQAKKV